MVNGFILSLFSWRYLRLNHNHNLLRNQVWFHNLLSGFLDHYYSHTVYTVYNNKFLPPSTSAASLHSLGLAGPGTAAACCYSCFYSVTTWSSNSDDQWNLTSCNKDVTLIPFLMIWYKTFIHKDTDFSVLNMFWNNILEILFSLWGLRTFKVSLIILHIDYMLIFYKIFLLYLLSVSSLINWVFRPQQTKLKLSNIQHYAGRKWACLVSAGYKGIITWYSSLSIVCVSPVYIIIDVWRLSVIFDSDWLTRWNT